MIPSTEIAFHLRLAADESRRRAQREREREERAAARSARRREFWARVRAGLTAGRREGIA
jgi:hypothetical protein